MRSAVGGASDFSLVLGGPLFQLWHRTRLSGDALQLVHRRMLAVALVAWLPLLVLSQAEGRAFGPATQLPFLNDLEMHCRLLLALPLLIYAEVFVHQRMRPALGQFLARELIPADSLADFERAIASANRMRNSVAAEVLMLVFVYAIGVAFVWRLQPTPEGTTWHGALASGAWRPTLAGWWLALVSLPIFQFILIRWYYRIAIWGRLMWQVAGIELQLQPSHPDRCGGLGFLSGASLAFAPVLLAQGILLAGMIANRLFFADASLLDFKVELAGLVGVLLLAVLAPTFAFTPRLVEVKRDGVRDFGMLAQAYSAEFNRKWLRGGAAPEEPLLGSADVQSLADLGSSYHLVNEMRWFPFSMRTVVRLAIITLLPVAPLLLTVVPLDELLARLLKVVF